MNGTLTERGIKCAHCKGYHPSVAEVRDCSKREQAQRFFDAPVHTEVVVPPLRDDQRRAAVPAGRYAVRDEGIIKFYIVDRPTEGRWAGRIFVKRQVSDDLFPLKTWRTRNVVLDQIAEDIQGAMLLYGREIGACGHCGRTLTNEESRRAGIGPVCRSRMGW